jgi:uncharacterized repeat protein (TIGR01451 family)
MSMKTMSRAIRVMPAIVFFAFVLASTTQVEAQQAKSPLTVTYKNITLERDSARVKARRAGSKVDAAPSDTLRYELVFSNNENKELRNIVFNNPLPAGLVLVAGSAGANAPATIAYSIDGGRTYSAQPIMIVTENGVEVQKPAPVESYTHIRWTITGGVPAGSRVTARFDARVGARAGAGR